MSINVCVFSVISECGIERLCEGLMKAPPQEAAVMVEVESNLQWIYSVEDFSSGFLQ
jgi:hypothetical protein